MAMKRLYECDSCHTRRFVNKVELDRAAKFRCFNCGCTILNLVSDDGKKEMQNMNRQRVIGTGGSLTLASNADKPNRKVT